MKKAKRTVLRTAALMCAFAMAAGTGIAAVPAFAETSEFSYTAFAQTYMPQTGIVNAPTVVFDVDSEYDIDALSAQKSPAVAIFHADASGNAVGEDGSAIATLDEAVRACANRVIPAFFFSTTEQMNAVLSYVTAQNLLDTIVFSDDALLVKTFKASRANVQGGVWFSDADLTDYEALVSVRDTVSSANAMIAVVEGNVVKEGVEELQALGLSCWAVAESSPYGVYETLYTGVNGVISDSFSLVIDIMESITEPTMIRKVFLAGHRGEGAYPENTIVGAKAAYYYGADYVEIDLMRTKDNELIIMHDPTLNRTCNYTGSQTVADMTLEEVRQYKVGGQYEVPILEDFLQFAAERPDVKLLIEMKTSDAAVVPLLVEKLNEYGIDDQIIVITAFTARLTEFKAAKPNIVTGNLNSYKDIASLCYYAYSMNSVFAPGYTYLDSTDVMIQGQLRGIPCYSCTFSTVAKFEEYMYLNNSLTSDYSSYVKDQMIALTTQTEESYEVQEQTSVSVTGTETLRQRTKVNYESRTYVAAEDLTLVSGADLFRGDRKLSPVASFDNGELTLGAQEGYGIYYFTAKWENDKTGNYYYMISRPFEVVSSADAALFRAPLSEEEYKALISEEVSDPEPEPDPDPDPDSDEPETNGCAGCGTIGFGGSGGGIALGCILAAAVSAMFLRRRSARK